MKLRETSKEKEHSVREGDALVTRGSGNNVHLTLHESGKRIFLKPGTIVLFKREPRYRRDNMVFTMKAREATVCTMKDNRGNNCTGLVFVTDDGKEIHKELFYFLSAQRLSVVKLPE